MIANKRDVLAGLMFVGIGIFVFIFAQDYGIGTAAHLGPGVFPMLLSALLTLLGLTITVVALRDHTRTHVTLSWRPLIVISAALLLFGFGLDSLGLFVVVALLVVISRFARAGENIIESVILALVVAAVASLVFVVALGLPVPLWPTF